MNAVRLPEAKGSVAAALAVTIVFFGGILSLRGLRVAVPLPPPEPARLRFLPVEAGSPAAASREIWSPVLFSLPSDVGFGHGRGEHALVRPPLEPPTPLPAYLTDSRVYAAFVPVLPAAAAGGRADERFLRTLRPAEPVLTIAPEPLWQAEFAGGWSAEDLEVMDWPVEAAGDRAWEAEVRLVFNERGEPVHVFVVESAVRLEIGGTLSRALRAWRLAIPPAVREGRVRIRFSPQSRRAGD